MTNFNVIIIDEHDCNSTCGEFTIEAVDRADADVRLQALYGDTTYFQVNDIVHCDEI